jgi:hypothetical protein
MDVTERLDPAEAAALRERLVRETVLPEVRAVFAEVPEVQSAVFCVGQFWCDEADDAVHSLTLFSAQAEPDLDRFQREKATFENAEGDRFDRAGMVLENDSTLTDEALAAISDLLWRRPRLQPRAVWDSNGEAIPAFAAFCEEDAHQEMPPQEPYSPYAVFRRGSDGPVGEIVGVMLRPDHDGVPPSLDLDLDLDLDESETPARGRLAPKAREAPKRSWLGRLFGRN